MAAVTTILAIASLVVAAGAAYMSYKADQASARFQRKAAATSAAEMHAQQQAQVRQQVRQERVRRAQIIQASQNDGVTGSSGSLGAQSSLGSTIESNVSSLGRQGNSAMSISGFNQQAANAQGRSNMWQGIGSVAGGSFSMFSNTAGFQNDFNNMFGGQKTPDKVS